MDTKFCQVETYQNISV